MTDQCARDEHNWIINDPWGVVIGISKCALCDKMAERNDFDPPFYSITITVPVSRAPKDLREIVNP